MNDDKKRNVTQKITNLTQRSGPIVVTEEILNTIKPGDIIEAGYNEGWESSDSATDPYFFFIVTRQRKETDEEYDKRIKHLQKLSESSRNARYQTYLKLKAEFDN